MKNKQHAHSACYGRTQYNQMDFFPAVSIANKFFSFFSFFFNHLWSPSFCSSAARSPLVITYSALWDFHIPTHLLLASSSSSSDSHSSPLSLCSNPQALLFCVFSGTVRMIGKVWDNWLTDKNNLCYAHCFFFLIKLFILLPEATLVSFSGRVKSLIYYLWSVSFFAFPLSLSSLCSYYRWSRLKE